MHAATLRRLLVLGVCVAGVSCLYLVPGVARAPHPTTGPRPQEDPSARPSATVLTDVSASTRPSPSTVRPPASTPEPDQDREPARRPVRVTEAPSRAATRGSTPFDPGGADDEVAPAPVAAVTRAAATPEQLTVRWQAAVDNVGVVS